MRREGSLCMQLVYLIHDYRRCVTYHYGRVEECRHSKLDKMHQVN